MSASVWPHHRRPSGSLGFGWYWWTTRITGRYYPSMAEPFRPTHRLTVVWPSRVQVAVLHLDALRGDPYGCAYTETEWARDEAASWEHREEGWMLDGIPLTMAHPDRPAATSVQVERLGR